MQVIPQAFICPSTFVVDVSTET